MHFSAFLVLAAPLFAFAMPLPRQDSNSTAGDLLVLRSYSPSPSCNELIMSWALLEFADVLEQLESQFYSQALTTFQSQDFLDAGFTSSQTPIQLFTGIQNDEQTHDLFLQVRTIR
jgi:hypothetical protein